MPRSLLSVVVLTLLLGTIGVRLPASTRAAQNTTAVTPGTNRRHDNADSTS
jgi:hypothetical protein